MKLKKVIIILENEIDLKTWLSLNKSYNLLILNQIYNLFYKNSIKLYRKLIA